MALLVLAILMVVMTGRASCTWCVCKEMSSAVLQQTLDYACGAGADSTSKKRVRPKALVISKALLRFLHLILALAAALTLPASGELSIGALDLFSKMGRLLSD
ncbi:BETA-13 GLUCANASE [Salix purpurea]|uniref:BETA-13 GLUCANASE n=1 Tax=Salix purpurea TaxID=77065 RepID=A0A9Q0W2U8_SALPP|nr:BETA-13 GLUCANASE [Salix purpurea]